MPRVGVGFDVHAFDPARPLWLGGILWPEEPGLVGHSDGDVLTHAATDALLSAAGLGDLGTCFGTDRDEYKDASSCLFLEKAAALVAEHGFIIGNIALQLIAARPQFSSRRLEAQSWLSTMAGAPVSIAATTTDRLGFLGRSEGAAAVATALVYTREALA